MYLLIRASKLGSGRSDLLDTSFLRQVGHSLFLETDMQQNQCELTRCSVLKEQRLRLSLLKLQRRVV